MFYYIFSGNTRATKVRNITHVSAAALILLVAAIYMYTKK